MVSCNQRDSYFDLVKAIAIFLVVLGHCGSELRSVRIENFIVGCNMPLFFILSGWFAYDTIINRDVKRLIKHLKSYLYPILSTAFIFAIVSAVMGLVSWTGIGMFVIKKVLFSAWFLWTLSIIYLICFVISLAARQFKLYCIALGVVFCILLFIPNVLSGVLNIHTVRHMMPYFIVGMAFRRYDFRPWKITRLGLLSFLLFAIFAIVEGDIRKNGMGFYWIDSSWRGLFGCWYNLVVFLARNIVGIIGSVGVMWLIYGLTENLKNGLKVALIGRYTICIYLLHFVFLESLKSCCPVLFKTWWNITFVSVALTVFCGIIGWLTMEKSKVLRCIVWGR